MKIHMIRTAALALAVLCALLSNAEARQHHRSHRHHHHRYTTWSTFTASIGQPARYIAGRLVCAINVNAELARRGVRGTGSALAKSFLRWGHSTSPVPGAVAVYGRRGGGHVAIVSRVENGRVFVWNPSSRGRAWREVEYRKPAIDYRAPS